MTPYVTDWKECTIEQGRTIAVNKDNYVRIGNRTAIIRYNYPAIDFVSGEHHGVALEFVTPSSTASEYATPECEQLVTQLFPEYAS